MYAVRRHLYSDRTADGKFKLFYFLLDTDLQSHRSNGLSYQKGAWEIAREINYTCKVTLTVTQTKFERVFQNKKILHNGDGLWCLPIQEFSSHDFAGTIAFYFYSVQRYQSHDCASGILNWSQLLQISPLPTMTRHPHGQPIHPEP